MRKNFMSMTKIATCVAALAVLPVLASAQQFQRAPSESDRDWLVSRAATVWTTIQHPKPETIYSVLVRGRGVLTSMTFGTATVTLVGKLDKKPVTCELNPGNHTGHWKVGDVMQVDGSRDSHDRPAASYLEHCNLVDMSQLDTVYNAAWDDRCTRPSVYNTPDEVLKGYCQQSAK
jgi:hypothetical protein